MPHPPTHSFDRIEELHPGEVLGAIMPGTPEYLPQNTGRHLVHTGGSDPSYLQLPVMST